MGSGASVSSPDVSSPDVMVHTADPGSLEDFVLRVRSAVERALVARFGVHDGMDAAAHALEYACAEWGRLSAMTNPAGYVYRVGQSYAVRSGARRRRTDLLVAEPATTDAVVDVDLQRALQRLRPEHRVAVVLVHGHGHTYAQAAEILDVPVTTITNHVTRGLDHLRRLMEA